MNNDHHYATLNQILAAGYYRISIDAAMQRDASYYRKIAGEYYKRARFFMGLEDDE